MENAWTIWFFHEIIRLFIHSKMRRICEEGSKVAINSTFLAIDDRDDHRDLPSFQRFLYCGYCVNRYGKNCVIQSGNSLYKNRILQSLVRSSIERIEEFNSWIINILYVLVCVIKIQFFNYILNRTILFN